MRYWTAGESHGKRSSRWSTAFRLGLRLRRRRLIASSTAGKEATAAAGGSGLKPTPSRSSPASGKGQSLGSPIALEVVNSDYKLERLDDLPKPRPGHGDLTGAIKYLGSIRGVLERASARETAVRVAAGALAKQLLAQFGIKVFGYVVELGGEKIEPVSGTPDELIALRDASEIYSLDPSTRRRGQTADRRNSAKRATRSAASSRCASKACRSASARMPNGTASSTAGSPKR